MSEVRWLMALPLSLWVWTCTGHVVECHWLVNTTWAVLQVCGTPCGKWSNTKGIPYHDTVLLDSSLSNHPVADQLA